MVLISFQLNCVDDSLSVGDQNLEGSQYQDCPDSERYWETLVLYYFPFEYGFYQLCIFFRLDGLWLTHVGVWQRPTHYCEAISLQLKMSKFRGKKISVSWVLHLKLS